MAENITAHMDKSLESLKHNFSKVRTGRANANILSDITVDYYGVPTPVTQVAAVKTPEAHMLLIEPWDKALINAIVKAIGASDLGITPNSDGTVVRLPFPAPTGERRRELVKECREYAEQAKVSIRNIRRDFNNKLERDEELTEDDVRREQAKVVTCKAPYEWTEGAFSMKAADGRPGFVTPAELPVHVVAYDFGVKTNILRMLVERGMRVTVVPAQTPVEDVLAMNPDGVFLSNGPGDPAPCTYAIEAAREIIARKIPLFGICLGHQIMGLAVGAKTLKMKFGHHGANHPVVDLRSRHVYITSQNHGFAVDAKTLPANAVPTHESLFDGSLQGFELTDAPAFCFQGHPEASPGPHDIAPLFDHFRELIERHRAA